MTKKHKIITYCIMGTLAFGGQIRIAKAEEMPIAGIDLLLNDYFHNDEVVNTDIKSYLADELSNEYADIAFAQVTSYLNIRSAASEEGEILGKLYNNSVATILEKADGWYKVKSGTVTGYMNADYLITGREAKQLAEEIGTRLATVIATTLKVRDGSSLDSTVLTLVPIGEELIVEEELEGWIKVALYSGKSGYVSSDYVELKTEFEEAVSIEEEQERLEAEQAALEAEQIRLAEQTAITAEQKRVVASEKIQKKSIKLSTDIQSDNNTSTIRKKIVEYALQFEGNPYVWGGTSLTKGADCSGFTQSVFKDNGISIPRTSRTQATGGKRISINEMQPGDLIFYQKNGRINHVALYIGNGKVIGASSPKTGIRISSYNYREPYRVVSYINN